MEGYIIPSNSSLQTSSRANQRSRKLMAIARQHLFGYTFNIFEREDQNFQWSREYSYYSSHSTQNEVIWTSRIALAGCVPEVFECKEVVSWCIENIYFKPNNYSTARPLSCFFVTSGLPQYIEIVATNIERSRRRLQGIPKNAW